MGNVETTTKFSCLSNTEDSSLNINDNNNESKNLRKIQKKEKL